MSSDKSEIIAHCPKFTTKFIGELNIAPNRNDVALFWLRFLSLLPNLFKPPKPPPPNCRIAESAHKLSLAQPPNSPTISRPQEAHSCESRNLTVSRIQITAKSPAHFRSPPRPFLRRQESHSVVYTNNGKIAHTLPFSPETIPAKAGISQCRAANGDREGRCPLRFLPTQEWSEVFRQIVDKTVKSSGGAQICGELFNQQVYRRAPMVPYTVFRGQWRCRAILLAVNLILPLR